MLWGKIFVLYMKFFRAQTRIRHKEERKVLVPFSWLFPRFEKSLQTVGSPIVVRKKKLLKGL